jgi:Tol biopolymer transport system component
MHRLQNLPRRRAILLAAIVLGACSDDVPGPIAPAGVTATGPLLAKGAGNPNNRRIVFNSNRDGSGVYRIHTMKADGTAITRLTTSATNDNAPTWSPDGSRIAFVCTSADPRGEICVMNADGTGLTRLTTSPGLDNYPTWSNDGTKIAFFSLRAAADPINAGLEAADIYVMNADGTGVTRLTNRAGTKIYPGAADISPAWSPDGTRIAFLSSRGHPTTSSLDIYLMNPDGTNVVRLAEVGVYSGSLERLSWDSQSRRLAYAVDNDIFVIDVVTRAITQIGFGAGKRPSWSPNDGKLVFQSLRDGNHELYQMNADGSGQTRLTVSALNEAWPTWAR